MARGCSPVVFPDGCAASSTWPSSRSPCAIRSEAYEGQAAPGSIQNDSGLSQGRRRTCGAHSVRDRPTPLNDALGSKGERSCTTIRQAPGGWQCRASGSPKISRVVRMCSVQSIFGIGRSQHVARRTANMMLRLNRLTVSPRAHQRGHGFRPDGELVAVETTHRRMVMCYR
jgi:hypothetical protein